MPPRVSTGDRDAVLRQIQLDPSIRFDNMPVCDRQSQTPGDSEYRTSLAQRYASKKRCDKSLLYDTPIVLYTKVDAS